MFAFVTQRPFMGRPHVPVVIRREKRIIPVRPALTTRFPGLNRSLYGSSR